MAHQTYRQQLLDPRWQKKRLQILERDCWACTDCQSKTNTLHVHHTYYEHGLKVWEYPDFSLKTLCKDCHKKHQDMMTLLHKEIGEMEQWHWEHIVGYLRGLRLSDCPYVTAKVDNLEIAHGIAMGFCEGLTAEIVIDLQKGGVITGQALHDYCLAHGLYKTGKDSGV